MINKIGLMDKDKLMEIFSYLNERLRENQLQLEITVYGESIMTMVYDSMIAGPQLKILTVFLVRLI